LDHVLIIPAVRDYGAWKQVFDAAASLRRDAGERSFQVLRDTADPNREVHVSRWESIARAKAFFESPELVEIRRQAGVESPEFPYLLQQEGGTL
jgi:quinol monooxygenase YgiN